MRTSLGRAAVCCSALLRLADAKALKWSADENEPRWVPAAETQLGFLPSLGMNNFAAGPQPTSPPEPRTVAHALVARDSTDNTCGYVSGSFTSSLWCASTARCVYNSINSHIGCCDDGETKCPIWTTCYDSTERSSFSTNNGYTMWCGSSDYPHCMTHVYQESWAGYTLFGCGVAAATDKIWYQALDKPSSTSSSSTTSAESTSTTSTSTSTSATETSSSTPSPTPGPAPNGGSSTPVGPIVGGVVGGVAVLALIGAGIWAIRRHSKKSKQVNPDPAAAAAAAGNIPPNGPNGPNGPASPVSPYDNNGMSQPPYYTGGAAAFDPRASLAKPPVGQTPPGGSYDPMTGAYIPPSVNGDHSTLAGSPAPGSPPLHTGYQGTPSPPPPGQGGYPQYGQQQQQQQQGGFGYAQHPGQQHAPAPGQQGYTAELPAERGDGEVRELQG
ncbi:uncharacterized protein C8A04DRAFT_24945 [Dichotomopilus funicola]|uniref:Uncharacterized protein n=1 Tax=Dichotomopilus funicola TaxID=1934379 RepID=A0AAN6V989_9PEZI|nr:hypothetical protein C8A04DRAFT_24945 [Dichotomopilus funicola]